MNGSRACSVMVVLLLGGVALGLAAQNDRQLRPAPDFSLFDWQGSRVSLSDLRGQVVILQFFQTGCSICRREAGLLQDLHERYKGKGVVFLGISHERGGAQAIQEYAEKFGITFALLVGDLESGVRYLGLSPQRPAYNTPHFFFIDREGRIVREIDRARDPKFFREEKQALENAIEELLAVPPTPGEPNALNLRARD